MLSRSTGMVAFLLVLCTLTGCGGFTAHREISLTVPWENLETIVVRNVGGNVQLTAANSPAVRVDAQIRVQGDNQGDAQSRLRMLDVVALKDEKNPGTLVIELRCPATLNRYFPGATMNIALPAAVPADIRTTNGSISASRLDERVILQTTNGNIEASDLRGDINIHASNGRVNVLDSQGDLDIRGNNTSVTVRGFGGNCRVRTSRGPVEIESGAGNVDAATSDGPITIVAMPEPEGVILARTSNGAVRLVLPTDLRGELELRTADSAIVPRLGEMKIGVRLQRRDYLRAVLNEGGAGRVGGETTNAPVFIEFR